MRRDGKLFRYQTRTWLGRASVFAGSSRHLRTPIGSRRYLLVFDRVPQVATHTPQLSPSEKAGHCFVMVGACFLTLLMFVATAYADDLNRILREDVEALHREVSPDIDARNRVSVLQQEAESLPQLSSHQQKNRTRTHIKMSGGLAFPLSEHVVLESKTETSSGTDGRFVEAMRIFELPPRCDQNHTDREERGSLALSGAEETLLDSVYLREELAPVDASEVFGQKTRVFPYGPKSNPGVLYRMRADEIPCVPFRIRVTSRALYRDRGENALKNYDRDPSDRGTHHPWIARKISGKTK